MNIHLDRSKQITLLVLLLAVVGLTGIYFAISNIEPVELEIGAIGQAMAGKLVRVSGRIDYISKSRSGNIYWTIDDGNNITVPLLESKFKKMSAKSGDEVEIVGLVSVYKEELEIMPKEISVG